MNIIDKAYEKVDAAWKKSSITNRELAKILDNKEGNIPRLKKAIIAGKGLTTETLGKLCEVFKIK